jgi:regulator of protease activity HflC (stomatin/prohibitin superfamily)
MSRSADRPPNLARELGRLSAEAGSEFELEVPGWLSVAGYTALVVLLLFALFGTSPATVVGVALLVVVVGTVYSAVEIVQAYERAALTVFGEYRGLLDPGLNLVVPFVSAATRFDLRTETVDVPTQEAITRDNSPVTADAVVYIRVMDAERAFLEVDDYRRATLLLAQTTLRAVIGDMNLDETLSRRERINERIRRELDRPTDEWGVRVESVEVREVKPSADVEAAMEQQTSAERRRRATILEAQGERRSAVERAEGDRTANVLRAQGQKQASVLEAQGDAISTVLRARSAESMGERAIVDKGMETLAEIGGSESTTFLLPQELTSLLGRYGRRLTGGDVAPAGSEGLDSGTFDAETTELLGLDEIEALAAGDGSPGRDGAENGFEPGVEAERAGDAEADEEWE